MYAHSEASVENAGIPTGEIAGDFTGGTSRGSLLEAIVLGATNPAAYASRLT